MKRSLLSGLLITTMLLSACNSSVSTSRQTDNSVKGTAESAITESTSETSETTEEAKVYDFMWGDAASKDFSNYLEKKLGVDLGIYLRFYGFTDELNIIYSEYMEKNYRTEGRVSFATSNYFFTYMDTCGSDGRRKYRNFEIFEIRFLSKDECQLGTLNNKFIMSYLCQNKITLGSMIPKDNFKSISDDYINICKDFIGSYYDANKKLGNLDNSYNYSAKETLALMALYNNSLGYIFYSESIKDYDLFSKPEAVKELNQHLKKYYGANAPQFGEIVTADQYRAMFGEEPLDLSYIPGAVVNQKAS